MSKAKAKGDKKIEMEKEEEENEGGGAETTMETAVNAAVAAEMSKVHATMEKMGNEMANKGQDGQHVEGATTECGGGNEQGAG